MPDQKRPRGPFADPEEREAKVGLKKVSGQKSMFEGKPRPSTPQEFQQQVQQVEDRKTGYKQQAADLFVQFTKLISDKTLPQNRNALSRDAEREMLQEMVQLAIDINNDPNEPEGMGSLTWITCLFKVCLAQKDRINELEFRVVEFQKKLNGPEFVEFINKEIIKVLDKKKSSE
jgi:hypothetical protein